jgi:hypothetical protein
MKEDLTFLNIVTHVQSPSQPLVVYISYLFMLCLYAATQYDDMTVLFLYSRLAPKIVDLVIDFLLSHLIFLPYLEFATMLFLTAMK